MPCAALDIAHDHEALRRIGINERWGKSRSGSGGLQQRFALMVRAQQPAHCIIQTHNEATGARIHT